jgi:hypothetical protein
MVNAEDAALRANRLGLLATLHQAMNRVADLSQAVEPDAGHGEKGLLRRCSAKSALAPRRE